MKKLLFILLLLFPLTSQAGDSTNFIDDQMGKSLAQVIALEGQPSEIQENADGSKAVVYKDKLLFDQAYQLIYFVYENTVVGFDLRSNESSAVKNFEIQSNWSILKDLGMTNKDFVAKYGPPQLYTLMRKQSDFTSEEWFLGKDIEFMNYVKMNICGHFYDVTVYAFENQIQAAILTDSFTDTPFVEFQQYVIKTQDDLKAVFDDPIWLSKADDSFIEATNTNRWKNVCYLTDGEIILALVASGQENNQSKLFNVMFWDMRTTIPDFAEMTEKFLQRISEVKNDPSWARSENIESKILR